MAKPKKLKSKTGQTTTTTSSAPNEDLPAVRCLGITKTKAGWVVVQMETEGDRVVDYELVDEPGDMATAWERFRIAAVRQIYQGLLRG